jgi:hypothetical protein
MVQVFFGPDGPPCTVTGSHGSCGGPTRTDLLVQTFSDWQWRLLGRLMTETDVCSLPSSIENKPQQFKELQLCVGFGFVTFASLDEARSHFSEQPEC